MYNIKLDSQFAHEVDLPRNILDDKSEESQTLIFSTNLRNIATTINLTSEECSELQPSKVLTWKEVSEIKGFLINKTSSILITDAIPNTEIITKWKESAKGTLFLLVYKPCSPSKIINSNVIIGDQIITAFFDRSELSLIDALTNAERLFTTKFTSRETQNIVKKNYRKEKQKVLIVGAGAVGLMTALELVRNGYSVQIVEKSSDPRKRMPWKSYGCTHGGENARMFSLTECDNYHDQVLVPGIKPHGHMDKCLNQNGWKIGNSEQYSLQDDEWVAEFSRTPIWLAKLYNSDIFDLNHESYTHWKKIKESLPELFENVGYKDGLLRICRTPEYHTKQVKRQKAVKTFVSELNTKELISRYPALESGCVNGEISGGIEVDGFTLNIHCFSRNLINYLESNGVSFRWNTEIDEVISHNDKVVGLRCEDEILESGHYFIATGAYGERLLQNTHSSNKVHGVLGAWISFPNISPKLEHSLKISREGHIACSGNIILAKDSEQQDTLIFGSGFGYMGKDLNNISDNKIENLFQSMESYIKAVFPKAYDLALESGELRKSRKYCVRPWTPSSLGVFEVKEAESGCLIIASGHNTGGFTQSTSVALATLDAFEGRTHPMHCLYHPKRFEEFWNIAAD